MGIKLKELVTKPDSKWFFQRVENGNRLFTDSEEEADIGVHLAYMNQREFSDFQQDIVARNMDRKVIGKKGMKALIGDEMQSRKAICRRVVKGWKLNVRGAYALGLEADLGNLAPDDEIEFSMENLMTMAEHSNFGGFVLSLMTDHEKWFDLRDDEEEAQGNSESGQNGSTAASPVLPASTPT